MSINRFSSGYFAPQKIPAQQMPLLQESKRIISLSGDIPGMTMASKKDYILRATGLQDLFDRCDQVLFALTHRSSRHIDRVFRAGWERLDATHDRLQAEAGQRIDALHRTLEQRIDDQYQVIQRQLLGLRERWERESAQILVPRAA